MDTPEVDARRGLVERQPLVGAQPSTVMQPTVASLFRGWASFVPERRPERSRGLAGGARSHHPGAVAVADIRMNQHFEPVGIYARGFLDSAHALFQRADEGRGLVDFAFYPAAYCLRHGIELFVKQMTIYVAYAMADEELLYAPDHDLEANWKKVRAAVEWTAGEAAASLTSWGEEDMMHQFDVIDSTLQDLHDLDPRGTLLRYPEFVKKSKADKPRERIATPPPFDVVNLGDWKGISGACLTAAMLLLSHASEAAEEVACRRGHTPFGLQDLTIGPS